MTTKPRQPNLFAQPTRVKIELDQQHELVRLENTLDWDALIELAMDIREKKIRGPSGTQPHYRELLGAVALMALKNITYRDAEDLILHYAPAKYLCGLMDTNWRLDHVTIFEFTQMMGEEGMRKLNGLILQMAIDKGFADPSRLMSDTTAQEAKIPYPTEVGLMSKYASKLGRALKGAGKGFEKIRDKFKKAESKIKGLVRNSHLFAKTQEQKQKIGRKLWYQTEKLHSELKKALDQCSSLKSRSRRELKRLTDVMTRLLPQMFHFLKTGFVAKKKILHLNMDDVYSILRGKSGKATEFGIKWGINRIGGGFLAGFVADGLKHCPDQWFCIESIQKHMEDFGTAPETFGFDRGGYSGPNIRRASKLGVRDVGIAPKGKAKWAVNDKKVEAIRRERAQVEGCIGTIKKPLYGFNKPDARSTAAMTTYGQRAIFGFNMRKLVRELSKLQTAAT